MFLLISHGRGGSPNDDLIVNLAKVAAEFDIDVEKIDDADIQNQPEERSQRLIERVNKLPADAEVILAGFSMGGYTSARAAEVCGNVRGAFLIAPALYMPHYGAHRWQSDLINVEIVHGWSDDVVIYEQSLRFARELNAPLHLLPGGHMLKSQTLKICNIFRLYLQKILRL
ncbi:MAG: alpha/beta hydrolase [Cardiobacteriaceae bacterium]|nr:alpha/beta hydrolase [Cardiobacteriaceae bacterium]